MIARIWQARTSGPQATEQYRQVFDSEVLGELSGLPGFHGAYLLARHDGGPMEIRTMTLFESFEAVRRFAPEQYDREQVTAAARATLLDSDPFVRHFDILTHFRG
jgi:heme-degrading monooxygenase HmoA